MSRKRIGFFTRALDDASPTEAYQLAVAQIRHAEAYGYHSGWVAQHHFNGAEVACPHLSRSCPMSPRKPRASGWRR